MRPLDVVIISGYIVALISIGVYFSRRQRTTEAYFIASRSIPGWAMGLSLLATIITSVTFIAYPGSAYSGNWSLLVPGIMFVILLLIIGFVIVPFFRHVVHMSAYEYFGKRFGSAVRLYSSLAFAVGHFSKMGFVFYLVALTLSSMTGVPVDRVIWSRAPNAWRNASGSAFCRGGRYTWSVCRQPPGRAARFRRTPFFLTSRSNLKKG